MILSNKNSLLLMAASSTCVFEFVIYCLLSTLPVFATPGLISHQQQPSTTINDNHQQQPSTTTMNNNQQPSTIINNHLQQPSTTTIINNHLQQTSINKHQQPCFNNHNQQPSSSTTFNNHLIGFFSVIFCLLVVVGCFCCWLFFQKTILMA